MIKRFNSYKNNLILSSVFALMAFVGGYHLGSQQNNREVRPEIRSSQTPIVQVERSAAARLQQQVEQDGGAIEETQVPTTVEVEQEKTVQTEVTTQKVETPTPEVEVPEAEEKVNQNTKENVPKVEKTITVETTVPAPEGQVEEEKSIFGQIWNDYIADPVKGMHNYMKQKVYQPTGNVISDIHDAATEYVYKPVGVFVTETIPNAVGLGSDEKVETKLEEKVTTPADEEKAPIVEKKNVEEEKTSAVQEASATKTEEGWWSRTWNSVVDFFGFGSSEENIKNSTTEGKPTGLNSEQPPVVKTVSPTGAREQAPQTPDMSKLTEFLKSKNLSDADIQIAVALARGQEVTASIAQADKSWYEETAEDIKEGFNKYVATPVEKHVLKPVGDVLGVNTDDKKLEQTPKMKQSTVPPVNEDKKDVTFVKDVSDEQRRTKVIKPQTYELAKNIPTNVSITVNGPLYQARKDSGRT